MQNNRTTVKDFYAMSDEQQSIIIQTVNNHARKFFDAGDSISVCIRKTYNETDCTLLLVDAIVRHSPITIEYSKKHRITRQLRKFAGGFGNFT